MLTGDAAGPAGIPRGAGILSVYCAPCRGDHGHGASLTTIALGDFALNADAEALATFIAEGVADTDMPAFGKTMTRDQIDDVVAYLRSHEPAH